MLIVTDPIVVPLDIVEIVDAVMDRLRPRPEPTADLSWDQASDWVSEPAPAYEDDDGFTLH